MPILSVEVYNSCLSEHREFFLVKKGSFRKKRKLIYPSVLIRHSQGTVILDSGIGSGVDEELKQGSWLFRKLQPIKAKMPIKHKIPRDFDPDRDFFIMTHIHWDHLSGALDFPDIKIKLLEEDFRFGSETNKMFSYATIPCQLERVKNRLDFIELNSGPYEGFPKSLDLFQDGSLVLVPLPGHTPGSLGLFMNDSGKRVFFVGDAVLTVDDAGFPEERSPFVEFFFHRDTGLARRMFLKIRDLKSSNQDLFIVPNHDPRAFRLCGYECL